MEIILVFAIIFVTKQYIDYQIETKDKSLHGFTQYLKAKYYDKSDTRR